jgi:hypothetical protein
MRFARHRREWLKRFWKALAAVSDRGINFRAAVSKTLSMEHLFHPTRTFLAVFDGACDLGEIATWGWLHLPAEFSCHTNTHFTARLCTG